MTNIPPINELPLSLENFNASYNKLSCKDGTIFRVSFDRKTCAAALKLGNEYRRCHHKSHTTLPKLCTLTLSHNEELREITIHSKLPTDDPDASFKYFGRMNLVDQLNISNNLMLKIPTEVCQLKNMFEFEYHGIDDDETIANLNLFKHVKEKVQFLNPLYGNR